MKKILIIGGVAGGASCAARLRRLSEEAEIIVFDRGQHVSFANCGLPYFVGDLIDDEADLLMATPQLFRQRFDIDIRLQNEVMAVDPTARRLQIRDLANGRDYTEDYDALVLATGAAPVRPPLPGIDLPGIFALRTIPDSRRIRAWIETRKARRAVVVGSGFIGLEMAENLERRGLEVCIVEQAAQVMPSLDPEMARPLEHRLAEEGVELVLGDGVASFTQRGDGLEVGTASGRRLDADLVVLGIGVRPETALARAAGLKLGHLGGIRVDPQMRTSDPHIWAVGDAVEVRHLVTGRWSLIPLAGPANRQGRVAADSICGRDTTFAGVRATAVCGAFGLTAAATGANESALRQADMAYDRIYLHPGHHAGYYPGAQPIDMKLLFDPQDGRILGAQAVGCEGVEKRIDVIATAMQGGLGVFDLESSELCYAPQFGAAKDPVNIAGMIAANSLRGDAPTASWEDLDDGYILDVRDPDEYAAGHVPGACNIPLHQLRRRLAEVPSKRPVRVYCQVGQRAYYAVRILRQNGIEAYNLSGGYKTFLTLPQSHRTSAPA